ncbi:hypothetical protein [Kribbella deserti]|uniref:Uncharacterized protein n=1 Tax=Kribbella deserti TaxID=1926257 RepID=A0ABV6QI38_9ACTN
MRKTMVAAMAGNWISTPAPLRWSGAGVLDHNHRARLRRNGGLMVTRHKNADTAGNIAACARRDTDSAGLAIGFDLPSTVGGRQ